MTEHLALKKLSTTELEILEACEVLIEENLKAFYEAGIALLKIRDGKLYRETHLTFEDYCRQRWSIGRAQAYRLIEAAGVIDTLSPIGDILPVNEAQTRPLFALEPNEQREVWQRAIESAPNGKITGEHIQQTVEAFRTNKAPHQLLHSSESNEWYTPSVYIEAVRELLGEIDLDPATCLTANEIVKAAAIFTIKEDGLTRDWYGRVFLNCPYGRAGDNESNQARWSRKLIDEYRNGNVKEAILLVNAVTDCQWFKPLWDYPICFTDHRISFYNSKGEQNQPTHGNAFVYFGKEIKAFTRIFKQFGVIARKI